MLAGQWSLALVSKDPGAASKLKPRVSTRQPRALRRQPRASNPNVRWPTKRLQTQQNFYQPLVGWPAHEPPSLTQTQRSLADSQAGLLSQDLPSPDQATRPQATRPQAPNPRKLRNQTPRSHTGRGQILNLLERLLRTPTRSRKPLLCSPVSGDSTAWSQTEIIQIRKSARPLRHLRKRSYSALRPISWLGFGKQTSL